MINFQKRFYFLTFQQIYSKIILLYSILILKQKYYKLSYYMRICNYLNRILKILIISSCIGSRVNVKPPQGQFFQNMLENEYDTVVFRIKGPKPRPPDILFTEKYAKTYVWCLTATPWKECFCSFNLLSPELPKYMCSTYFYLMKTRGKTQG